MTELQRLLLACDEQLKQGRQCALATVVQVEGSAYRRPGARMLITDTGQLTGTISGGCLEGDARRRALKVMQQGKPEIVIYDSLDLDDDLEQGAQLGCQGLVHVLIEPVETGDKAMELLRVAADANEPAVLTTFLKRQQPEDNSGAVMLVTAGAIFTQSELNKQLEALLTIEARQALARGQSVVQSLSIDGEEIEIFFENLKPAPQLTIYGAGNDVQPLLKLAVNLGWKVNIVDGRANLVTPERFPGAANLRCVKVGELEQGVDSFGFAVLMSHNYIYDLAVLKALINKPSVQYIGILGPKKKKDRMLDDLHNEGHIIPSGFVDKVFGPVGLNIGAEAAEEIAVAIMAELVTIRNGHPAGFLRDLDGPIHKPESVIAYAAR
ncbi:XdhC family protein [Mucilaginibacter ginkgonis]|uniref:XdhC family protein n=1 Tax=Mucilaginibacter ginkgonis TaxID=2682091 RepID=A0A6I4HY23_9SPHI|nr:XdhC/CoxI family protein [Mucilaginibacter ginkgonis]QQL49576.1 XdhC family protein [Mucilaginibacter ginkgonis]